MPLAVALAVIVLTALLPAGRRAGESPPEADRMTGVVAGVVDGDTIKVRTGAGRVLTVRLLGIDTPETHRPGTPVECGGRAAAAHLAATALPGRRGRPLVLTTDPTQGRRDRYGRLLGYARLPSGELLQSIQLRAGWATVYRARRRPIRALTRFEGEERAARQARRGVWRACGGDFHAPARGPTASDGPP